MSGGMQNRFRLPPRSSGKRLFQNGLTIHLSTKLLIEDTGGDCWKGAVAMARFFEEEAPNTVVGKRILELASGTGVLGLHLRMIGAKEVIMTDKSSMIDLLRRNVTENEPLLAQGSGHACVIAASLDWLEATVDPAVVAGGPFDSIIMSDVIYEEEIVEPLVWTLRRLCHLNLDLDEQEAQHAPPARTMVPSHVRTTPIYICASHRSDRIEDLFFSAAAPWFVVKDLTDSLTPELKTLFRKDAIALWLLEARTPKLGDLITGIGPLQSLLTADDIEAQAVGERDESTIELGHGHRQDTTLDDDQSTEAGRRQQRRQTALILSILGANAEKAGPSLLVNPVKAATSGSCLGGSDTGHVEIECSGCCAPREQCECAWSDGGAMGGEHAGAAVATTHPNPRPSNGATGRALDRASTRVYHSQREDVDLTVLD